MIIAFPTATDAPIYHLPFATGGMVLLNIAVLILQATFPEQAEWFMLHFGTINPITWLTSTCMHAGVWHLVSNMFALAFFGWVIEGKVGWWRFLLIYFGIGLMEGAATQLIMFFFPGGWTLGASGVIFGLIAMTMVWAPENEVTLTGAYIIFIFPVPFTFNISFSTLGYVMVAMEFVAAAWVGFQISTPVLHLMGAVPGFIIAYFMLRWRRVDCDGYDFVSLLKGKRGERTLTVADEKAQRARQKEAKEIAQQDRESGLAMVAQHIEAGRYEMGVNRFAMLRKRNHALVMTESQLVTLIKAFDKDEATKHKTVPLINDYLKHYRQFKVPFTLMLARTHVLLQDRPRQGLVVLKTLDWDGLTDKQKQFVRQLIQKSKEMIADGVLEVGFKDGK
ncbi:MAG: rhomboid family intramembrane serine protease [Mariniblastus sp.]